MSNWTLLSAAAAAAATAAASLNPSWIGVGFGTAALGSDSEEIVTMALEEGFRRFDTAEAEYWYDQASVGRALQNYFACGRQQEEEEFSTCGNVCHAQDLRISTKIPPWSLTSHEDIRNHAAKSREELLGFCELDSSISPEGEQIIHPFPLDVYYIHAPQCWEGWHEQCDNPNRPETMDLHSAWLAMEAIVGQDRTARRIGISNVSPSELQDLIDWIQERREQYNSHDPTKQDLFLAPPRLPDVLQAYADPIYPAKELRIICQQYNIEFVSYSTLGTQHNWKNGRRNPVLHSPIIQELAQKYQRSTAEIVLQWAIQHGMSVIPRSSQRKHISQLARLLHPNTSFQLLPRDLEKIDAMENSI